MRIGNSTREANREGRAVDLVEQVRSYLQAWEITVVDPSEDGHGEATDISEDYSIRPEPPQSRNRKRRRTRRVSFDEAKFEETWLSEHSQPINPVPSSAPRGLLSIPPRRGRNVTSGRRTRSSSAQRAPRYRQAAPKLSQLNVPPAGHASDPDDHLHPHLYFEPSQTQLELNAEVIEATAARRTLRQALHALHDTAHVLQGRRQQAYNDAVARDRYTLLKQAFGQWRAAHALRLHEQRKERHLDRLCDRAKHFRDRFLLSKAFTHWGMSCQEEQLRSKVAQRHVLRVTYFRRWRAIASENQAKIRRILVRKYLAVWRERALRIAFREQQADAFYEERLLKKCKTAWFWHFCSHRVEGWHEQWIEKKGFRRLIECSQAYKVQSQQAEQINNEHVARRALRTIRNHLQSRQEDAITVREHHDRSIASKCILIWRKQAVLAPLARGFVRDLKANVRRRSFNVWRRNLALAQQASHVDRDRLLQNAWTQWNDSLRCKALAQKIDERVLMENLYRWILRERLSLFQRTINGRLLHRAIGWWRSKVAAERDQLGDAEVVFRERQRRRRLGFGMLRLNIAARAREDADRTALEFANSHAMPRILQAWKARAVHVLHLNSMAVDARFYCLCSRAIKTWKVKSSERKANRRRDAYIHVRARIKIRIVTRCFGTWQTSCTNIRSMNDEATRRAEARTSEDGAKLFLRWQERTMQVSELDRKAVQLDERKLLASVQAAMRLKHDELASKEQEALAFQRRIDLALLAGALRRLQWATFTALQKVALADAVWARFRDQHIRQMLRYWATQTVARRATVAETGEVTEVAGDEIESPSLRPASRAALRSTTTGLALQSSPPTQTMLGPTPTYLRTPSRPRRAGRFRPLPTPATFTPMAFDSSLIASTPAPASASRLPDVDERLFDGETPQVTPFSQRLRASALPQDGSTIPPPSALRYPAFNRSVQLGTGKSVRFVGSGRFGKRMDSQMHHS